MSREPEKRAMNPPRVLDVGQCDLDHGAIAGMLRREFAAEVDRAHTEAEAIAAVQQRRYDLVLLNRIFDRDGTEGLAALRRLKSEKTTRAVPVMLVSNYADAQDAAVAAGALRGFGKAAVESPKTPGLLADLLTR
jgi:CheY-like chemotaxis protein